MVRGQFFTLPLRFSWKILPGTRAPFTRTGEASSWQFISISPKHCLRPAVETEEMMRGLFFGLRTVVLFGVFATISLGASNARQAPSNCGRVGYNGNYTVFTNVCSEAIIVTWTDDNGSSATGVMRPGTSETVSTRGRFNYTVQYWP
jgi:hypothetical protein